MLANFIKFHRLNLIFYLLWKKKEIILTALSTTDKVPENKTGGVIFALSKL